jgi:hypothetical protein
MTDTFELAENWWSLRYDTGESTTVYVKLSEPERASGPRWIQTTIAPATAKFMQRYQFLPISVGA